MITKEDRWFAHPDRRKQLSELLNDPVLIEALEVVIEQNMRPIGFPPPGLDLRDYFAIMGGKKEGYNEAILNLKALSLHKSTPATGPKAWVSPRDNKIAPVPSTVPTAPIVK